MAAPVNVKLAEPTERITAWQDEAPRWQELNREAGGNPDFYPLTIKAAYVISVIHDLCESVTYLLRHPNARQVTYIPAYGLFASGIELLGRCVSGNPSAGTARDLKTGFGWLAGSPPEPLERVVLVRTCKASYDIGTLGALRHFAAHGQATSEHSRTVGRYFAVADYELLAAMPLLLASGLERYRNELQGSESLCNRLARANVIAVRGAPVLKTWLLFPLRRSRNPERDTAGVYHTLTEIFGRFDWHV